MPLHPRAFEYIWEKFTWWAREMLPKFFFMESYNNYYITFYLSIVLFFISTFGLMTSRKNLLLTLFCLEMLLVSLSLFFVSISYYIDDFLGQIMFLAILGLGAADISIALAILVRLHKVKGQVFSEDINKLKG